MKNIKTYILTLLAVVLGTVSAMADNVISFSGFDMVQGETKDIDIVLNNTDPVSVLQIEFTLPQGLSVVAYEGDLFQKVGRATRHSLSVSKKDGQQSYLLLLTSASMREMAAGNDAIITFTVRANSSFKPMSSITVNKIEGANKANQDIAKPATNNVINEKAHFILSSDPVEAKAGEIKTVTVNLLNKVKISQMQAKVILPEGLEIVPDAEGYLYSPTSRTQNLEIDGIQLADKKTHTLLIGTTDQNIEVKGTEGAILTFDVRANAPISDAVITIEEVVCSDKYASSITVDAIEIPVTITPGFAIEDVNEDGKVNISDAQAILDAIVAGEMNSRYDLNKDKKISISDVQIVLDYIIANAN